jgi:BirA family biotin operon repressor/biotin-[acetyl-CoA-carboxylase] ligase
MKIIELDCVDSTNEYCKRAAGEGDMIVTALSQTAGKGTKGRSFVSDIGGLYITIMRTLTNFDGQKTFRIMTDSCVAVCRTVQNFGLKPIIRWANDVLVGGKKICGTLIENTFLSNGACRSIVGMGLNVNNVLPAELSGIATTLSEQTKKIIDLEKVKKLLISNLQKSYHLDEYKSYINWFGEEVTLNIQGKTVKAVAKDVEEDGRLVCVIDGQLQKISSAEVSLRLDD